MLKIFKDTIDMPAPKVSFEFFPAKTIEAETRQWQAIKNLARFSPEFVSVTYGAGGTTKDKTYELIKKIKEETKLIPAAHITCIGASRAEVDHVARTYLDIGVNNMVALRGDMPGMAKNYVPRADGYAYADSLVAGLMAQGNFDISVAAYPEVHPEAVSAEADIDYLKRKIDAGAKRAITQFCFDTEAILRFIDKAISKNINVPIIPGVILIYDFKQITSFASRCGATIPKWLSQLFANADNEDHRTKENISVMVAVEQCRLLQQYGVEQFHFYTLNRDELVIPVCKILGL